MCHLFNHKMAVLEYHYQFTNCMNKKHYPLIAYYLINDFHQLIPLDI